MHQKKWISAVVLVVVAGVMVVYALNIHKPADKFRTPSDDAAFSVLRQTSVSGSHVTDFMVTINKWESPPSHTVVDVYFVTNRSSDVVNTITGGQTSKSNVYIGVFGSSDSELRALNDYLKDKHLSKIGDNYYSLVFEGPTPITIKLSALTSTAVPVTDWRMLLVATTVDKDETTHILWAKTIKPSK